MARPIFTPTDEQRRAVKALSGLGSTQEHIAIILDIAAHTLRKHFRKELDRGLAEANATVLKNLFEKATSNDTKATIYWLERQNRWAKTGSDTTSVPPQFVIKIEEKPK
jgi:transposase